MRKLKKLQQRVIEISKKYKLTHVSSCLSVLPLLIEVYEKKKKGDIVFLDNGHASLAWYVVLEEYTMTTGDAEVMLKKHGIHANRDVYNGIIASNGSLGHNVGISIAFALLDRKRDAYLIISDGSSMEPELGAGLRIAKQLNLENLKIFANYNGTTATKVIDLDYLEKWVKGYDFPVTFYRTMNVLPELAGVQGHYRML